MLPLGSLRAEGPAESVRDRGPISSAAWRRVAERPDWRRRGVWDLIESHFKGWAKPGPVPPGALSPPVVPDDETLDAISGHFRIFQLKAGHRFSTDDVLTAGRDSNSVFTFDTVFSTVSPCLFRKSSTFVPCSMNT